MPATNAPKFHPWSSEESFRYLVENIADYSIFMLDPQGRIASWNKGAERQFGFSEKEIIGKGFDVLFTEEDREKGEPQKEINMAKKEGRAPDRRFHLHKNGSKFFVDGTLVPMRDDFGNVSGFIKLIHKISEVP